MIHLSVRKILKIKLMVNKTNNLLRTMTKKNSYSSQTQNKKPKKSANIISFDEIASRFEPKSRLSISTGTPANIISFDFLKALSQAHEAEDFMQADTSDGTKSLKKSRTTAFAHLSPELLSVLSRVDQLTNKFEIVRTQTNEDLNHFLPEQNDLTNRVWEAMRYSALSDGKALRPFLVWTVGQMLDCLPEALSRIACAVEMVHTYSLIHDDLPAMDNDTLRRGKPTCHIAFDEATAILAGDGLLTKAFEILSEPNCPMLAQQKCRIICELAKCAGASGMIGGQMIDMYGETKQLSEEEIYQMQALKTGKLLHFSCIAPCFISNCPMEEKIALVEYAHLLGILFQMTDDLLDAWGDEQTIGKSVRKDAKANKSTFVSLYGTEKTVERVQEICKQALEKLEIFGERAALLKSLTEYIAVRDK